jgi:hypothetical protein
MAQDLRCPGKRHGIVVEPAKGGVVEVKCDSRVCGAYPGRVVLHRFDTEEGTLLETIKFQSHRKEVK